MNEFQKKISRKFAMFLSEIPFDINGNYDFKEDIDIGKKGEEFIKNFLLNRGLEFISDNNDNKYDLLMSFNGQEIKFEIKTDVLLSKQKDTGNIVVEFFSRDKPSGISVSEADYYVYYIPKLGEIWNIKMNDLKDLIQSNNFKKVIGGDSGSETQMHLISRKKNIKHFKVYYL